MNTKEKYREIGVAGCCGAVAGTAVAVVCDWSILLLLPSALVGALTAFVCYNPREVASTVGAFGRDMGGAMRKGVQVRVAWDEVRRVSYKALFIAACILIGAGSAALLPIIACSMGITISSTTGEPLPMWLTVMFIAFLGTGLGFFACLPFCYLLGGDYDVLRWMLPLTRRIRRKVDGWLWEGWVEWCDKKTENLTRGEALLLSVVAPLFLQVVGGLLTVALVLDAILTLLLACASSERIAAILGAMLGLCAATVLHFCGVPGSLAGSLVILAASGAVGWFAGPLLHRLREYLAQEPAVETVRSS